jgi:hypothetical protein
MSGVGLALARVKIQKSWLKLSALGIALAVGNLFPFPTPPFIKPHNQNRALMDSAITSLRRSALSDSILLTDYEGGLMLSYYLCSSKVVEIQTSQPFLESRCGDYRVVASAPELWSYDARTFPAALGALRQKFTPGADNTAWLFQAGWIDDKQAAWIAELGQFGCRDPQLFGQNILLCRIDSVAVTRR